MTPESAVVLSSSSSELAVYRPTPSPALNTTGVDGDRENWKTGITATTDRLAPPPECIHQSASSPMRMERRKAVSIPIIPATPPFPSSLQNVHVSAPAPLLRPRVKDVRRLAL